MKYRNNSDEMEDRSHKLTKKERKLLIQRRKINRDLGGNAKSFIAMAS